MTARRRDLLIVGAFCLLISAPFWGKAWHNDEPFFLAFSRQILRDPRHPLGFDYTWFGHPTPAAEINTTPPVLPLALAAALRLGGGDELATRLLLWPFDLIAALSLCGLAARFLKRPLLPVLAVLAMPAYAINIGHVMPEKPTAAFAFAGLYALVRGVDERDERLYWASSALLAGAVLSKYHAALFLVPAAAYARARGFSWRKIAGHAAAALTPLALLLAGDAALDLGIVRRAWSVTRESAAGWWSREPHKSRSLLAFVGGSSPAAALWSICLLRRRDRAWALAAAGACLLLFLPPLDFVKHVRPVDRLSGVAMAWGALLSIAGLRERERLGRGWALWTAWVAAGLTVQYGLYWSVMTRFTAFIAAPLTLAAAARLEASLEENVRLRVQALALALTVALTAGLALVDWRYARAQKDFARELKREFLDRGRRVWFSGYMGLEEYLEGAGGRGLDAAAGGWDLVQRGDVVAVLKINSTRLRPARPILADVRTRTLEEAIPLRLMSGWTGEGGFYSNLWGFLPYSFGVEPLEEFTVVLVK